SQSTCPPRYLHSFPTRRSSDLAKGVDDIFVIFGDTPLVQAETLSKLRRALAEGAVVAVLGFKPANPHGYGRLIMHGRDLVAVREDRKSTRLNSSHQIISYAVFC